VRATPAILLTLSIAALLAPACRPEVYRVGQLPADHVAVPAGKHAIVLVGDIMTWDRSRKHIERHGAGYPFLATAPLLRAADITVGNLEGPIAEKARLKKSIYPYKVPPWTLAGLTEAGFDLVSLANNHLLDCGHDGLVETFDNLDRAGIGYFGAGKTLERASRPTIVKVGGLDVAFVGMIAAETNILVTEDPSTAESRARIERRVKRTFEARANRPGSVVATPESVTRIVGQARSSADLVVLFPHWGVRYRRAPTSAQRALARAAVAAGADLIVGHHAHFWQPVEVIDGVPVIYGTGNFAFGSGNRRADEGLAVRAIVGQRRIESVEIFPLYIKNRDKAVRYQTKLLRGSSARDLIERLARQSAALGARIELERGRGVLRLSDRAKKR
jgi:poly-gamma-glutamate capsule biosynthesis protein CapA/YwtB (metallophosphatase superfamily)